MRVKSALLERGPDDFEQVAVELNWRDVDGDLDGSGPVDCVATGLAQRPLAHLVNEARVFRQRNELAWLDDASFWMTPAHQRLKARYGLLLRVDDRLVVEFELSL